MGDTGPATTGVLRRALRVLVFRATAAELEGLDRRHLALGLVCTWLVGVGRYWDAPRAHLVQHLGLGSVVYVFGLALLLWATGAAMRPRSWSFRRVLTFVTLTSPPAALYALPVERWLPLETANTANIWFRRRSC